MRAVPVGGSIELRESDGTVTPLALLQGYVENQGDAWSYTQAYLERFLTQLPGGRAERGHGRRRTPTPAMAC